MAIKKTIAVIGACTPKGKLASLKLSEKSIRLLLADEHAEELNILKGEIFLLMPDMELDVLECFQDAGWEADIIVLALDWQREEEIFKMVKPFITGKSVISFSKNNNCLLPFSNVIPVNDEIPDWPNEMLALLQEELVKQ